jgi:hypothetical protein
MSGMHKGKKAHKQLSIQEQAAEYALQLILFSDDDREILHIGSSVGDVHTMLFTKIQSGSVCSVNTNRLALCEMPRYDKIISLDCWDVVKKPREVFESSIRLLKSDGEFCAIMPYSKIDSYLDIHYHVLMSDKWRRYCKEEDIACLYNSKEMKDFLVQAGFDKCSHCSVVKRPFKFATKAKFVEWIASSPEQLQGIPEQDYQEFINDVVTNYLKKHPLTENNSVILYLPYMIVFGYK